MSSRPPPALGESQGAGGTHARMNHHYPTVHDGTTAHASLLIKDVLPNDVLLGRGTHANINEGNIRFRELVEEKREEYRLATKRLRKDMIARAVINEICDRGGRFLQLVQVPNAQTVDEDDDDDDDDDRPLWKEADDEVVLLKAKQALRAKSREAPKASALKKRSSKPNQEV